MWVVPLEGSVLEHGSLFDRKKSLWRGWEEKRKNSTRKITSFILQIRVSYVATVLLKDENHGYQQHPAV
jgi:hypothetical protein